MAGPYLRVGGVSYVLSFEFYVPLIAPPLRFFLDSEAESIAAERGYCVCESARV
jgi:hypothetical protein